MKRNLSVSVSCSKIDLANIGLFFESQNIPLAETRSGLVRQAVKFLSEIVKNSDIESFQTIEEAMTFFHSRSLSKQKWKDAARKVKHQTIESNQISVDQTIEDIKKELQKGI